MGASASLSQVALGVDPGGQTSVEIKVRNTGQVVDQFVIDVVGDTAGWATAEPATLNLFPGGEGTATVRFQPPKAHTVAAGEHPFGVRVFSKEDPEGSVVEEGVLEVSAFTETTAELLPRTSRGRRSAGHELAVDNRGNVRTSADVYGIDEDNLLRFDFDPPSIVTEPGTATFTKLRVKPKKRFLKGQPKTIPFRVTVQSEGQPPVESDGAMVQEQLLPKWLLPALVALLALAIMLWILWLTVLKSTVESAARDAVEEEVEEIAQAADEAAEAAQDAAGAAQQAAASAADAAGDGQQPPVEPVVPPEGDPQVAAPGLLALGPQFDFRIAADAAPGAGTFREFVFVGQPTDRALLITDIVLQNPRGDTGTLQIRRDDDVLLEIGLANFRDLDYHFVAPLNFQPGEQVILAVECLNVGSDCTPATYFSGVSAEPDDGA